MDKRQAALLHQWIEQGYSERAPGQKVTREEYERRRGQNPSAAHPYFDHCEAQGIPQIVAVYRRGAKYARVQVDYITTVDKQLDEEGQQELEALFTRHKGAGRAVARVGRRYIGETPIPVEVLPELMPQIVAIIREHSEARRLE